MYSNIPIAHADPQTGEFIGTSMAFLDPEESKMQGREIPLVPGNATLKIPDPAPTGMVNVLNEESDTWELVEDHRGGTYWLPSGESVKVTELGPVDASWLTSEPAPELIDIIDRVRNVRNWMLAESDWTQIPDASLTTEERTAWAECRQDLRDAPEYLTGEWETMSDVYKRAWKSPTPDMIMDLVGREPWE